MKNKLIMAALAGLTVAAPAVAQDWDWHGGGPRDPRAYELEGPGVPLLVPELRDTRRGQAWVMRNFDRNRDGLIEPWEAREANRVFFRIAGPDRARFDWEARDRGGPVVVEEEIIPLAPALRPFHPRQTRYGATFDIGDVLFDTDSARLRPQATGRLQSLAGFLRDHPRIAVRIDGFTDSRASAAHNQALSQARAASVAAAMVRFGVDPQRLQTAGHGESDPVATNATPAGRQQNRRVEVTFVGQRADRFGQ